MSAFMIVHMDITDPSWIPEYFTKVPAIFAEYGGLSLAGGLHVVRIEGSIPAPGRMAVLSFPSLQAIYRFMEDSRYKAFRQAREEGTRTSIFIFENEVTSGELV